MKNTKLEKATRILKQYTILFVIVILMVVFTIGNSNFIKFSNMITILRQSSILGIVGVGMMILLVSGGLNLAAGSIVSIVTVIIAMGSVRWGLSWQLSMFIAMIVATFCGWLIGYIIEKGKIVAMIGSLALATALNGVAYLICNGLPVYGVPEESKVFGQGFVFGDLVPVPVVIFVVIALIGAFVMNKTYIGRRLFAVGANEETARLSGIQAQKLHILAYTVSGFLAGIAGIIMYGRVGSGQPNSGGDISMNALIAVVLGGVSFGGGEGRVLNAMAGCIIISMLTNGLTLLSVDEYTQMVIRGVIFIGAVLFDSYQHRPHKVKKKKAKEVAA